MDPRPYTPILTQKNCIELFGLQSLQDTNPLRLNLQNFLVLLF